MNQDFSTEHRSGFVALVGRPNVGKSTLLNQLVGQKIAIVTPKPQTTRTRIVGIKSSAQAQLVFVDTPGLHHARNLINRRMVEVAQAALAESDVIVWVVDVSEGLRGEDRQIASRLAECRQPICIAVNKVDRKGPSHSLPLLAELGALLSKAEIVPVSALKGTNVDKLLQVVTGMLPAGPPLYDPETFTDQTERTLVAEAVREQVLLQTRQEIPYAVAVTVDTFEEKGDLVVIAATIHVERDAQKRIMIGAKGSRIKEIGKASRLELEQMLGKRVFLELFVRVQEDWTTKAGFLRELGM
ncbi:MAG TPA: GTPase Era [Terriglobales bacterium]|nr:GTPase Era [Terriglobales bacterium]